MKYLTLSADYMQPRLRDEVTGIADAAQFGLSVELVNAISKWNEGYQAVMPLEIEQRRSMSAEINRLDENGLALAERVAGELAPAKVRYYSEGWLKYLT